MAASKNCSYYYSEILSGKSKAKDNHLSRPKKTSPLMVLMIILSIAFVGISCKHKKYTYSNYRKLNKPYKVIKLKSSVINKFELFFPSKLAVIDNYLILVDSKADKLINIIDLNSNELRISFGTRGQGPDEFIGISQIIPDPNLTDCFWIYDLSTQKLKCFNITKILNQNFYPEKMIDVSSRKGFLARLIILPYQRMIGTGLLLEGRVAILNASGDLIKTIGRIPVVFKNKRFAPHHSNGFLSYIAYRQRTEEIYLATQYGSIIEKYNMEGTLLATYLGQDQFFPDYDIVPAGQGYVMTYNKKTRSGYLDIKYNKKTDKLFLLYSGKKKFSEEGKSQGGGEIIYVLDNRDILVEQIELDKNVYQIWISDDCSTILGLSDKEVLKFDYIDKKVSIGGNFLNLN